MKSLLLASFALVIAGLLVAWLLRRFRVQSPVLHRLAWASVLAQGLLFAGIPIELPLLEPPASMMDSFATELPANHDPLAGESLEAAGASQEVNAEPLTPFAPRFGALEVVTTIWFLGVAATLAFFFLSYGSLLLAVRRTISAPADWNDQWQRLLAARGIRKSIPLRVHDRLGPMLCRLPRGYVVVLPAGIWSEFSEGQRRAVLEHEIAHIERGDIWKTLLARLAMVPHWFNPVAWWAARQFEEAAEWACDRQLAKRESHVVEYARALLLLAEPKQPLPLGASLARGAALSPRIERLVNRRRRGESVWKGIAVALLIATVALVAAFRFEVVAQESAPEPPAVPDARFSEQVATLADDLAGSGESLDAFRELLGTPAGRIVMKDRAARAGEELKQAAQAHALEEYLEEHFERSGNGDDARYQLREGQEAWVEQFRRLHTVYRDDIAKLQPVMEEMAANLAEVSEAEKLMLRLLEDEKAAALIYVTALQKQTRPDAYAIAEELSHVFTGDGEGGFEIPGSRVEAASKFIERGLNLIKLSAMVHEEFVILADDFAQPDDMHRRLKAAAKDSAFAAVIAYQIGKKSENQIRSVTDAFDKAMAQIDEAFVDRGDGLHFNEEANRADLEELLDTYDAFRERGDILREPAQEFAAMISEKDELHRQWRTFVNSELGLATLVSAVEIGSAEPGELFKTMVGSVLEPAGGGKQRVQEDRRDEIIANMQKTLGTLRAARRKGRQAELLTRRIEDDELRELLTSTPGKLIMGQTVQRDLLTRRFDGLGFWIQQHFERSEDGKLSAKASAGEAIAAALEDAREIASNLKSDF